MKNNKKQKFTIFLFVMVMCFMGLKLDLESTQLGHYRSERYNFFSVLYEEPIFDRTLLIANIPTSLGQAYGAQGVDLDSLDLDTADIKIWGPVIDSDEAPANRVYNVVFHPDVQRWRLSDNDFNTNLMVGLFAPNGVVQAGGDEAIPFNTFGMVNVNKHDQIYYSPDNARFQLEPGRHIVSFWTAALSEDKTKTVIAFNVIIDQQMLNDQMSNIVNNSEDFDGDNGAVLAQIAALVASHAHMSAADKQAMRDAIALIKRITGMADQGQTAQERAEREQQEATDRELILKYQADLQQEIADQELAIKLEQQERAQAAEDQQRATRERQQAEHARALATAAQRAQQEEADRKLAEQIMREQEAQLPQEDADRAFAEQLQQQQ